MYAALSVLCGFAALLYGLLASHRALDFLVGMLFIIAGLLAGYAAETITTLLSSDGTIVITYVRVFGHKTWIRRLNRSNIQKIDYVKSFDDTSSFGKWRRLSSIYLNVNFNEQIEIDSRLGGTWTFSKLGVPIIKDSTPLDAEANEIATFLNVPLNIIDVMRLANGIKNFYNPRDKMRPILQRPTQQQLDHECDNPAAESVSGHSVGQLAR